MRVLRALGLILVGVLLWNVGYLAWMFATDHAFRPGECTRFEADLIPAKSVEWLMRESPWHYMNLDSPNEVWVSTRGVYEYDSRRLCEGFAAFWTAPETRVNFVIIDRYPDESIAKAESSSDQYRDPLLDYVDTGTHVEESDNRDKPLAYSSVSAIYQRRCVVVQVRWRGAIAAEDPVVRDAQILPWLDPMSDDVCPAVTEP